MAQDLQPSFHPPRPWASRAASTRCWAKLSFSSTNTPQSFSSGLLSIRSLPSLRLCLVLPQPTCRTLHLVLLSYFPLALEMWVTFLLRNVQQEHYVKSRFSLFDFQIFFTDWYLRNGCLEKKSLPRGACCVAQLSTRCSGLDITFNTKVQTSSVSMEF